MADKQLEVNEVGRALHSFPSRNLFLLNSSTVEKLVMWGQGPSLSS